MTSSFGITPQRQVGRELVARPEEPAALPRPAAPRPEPQQVGGQMLDASSFQPNRQAAESIKAIERFLGDQGVFEVAQADVFEDYKREKQAQAEQLLAAEATAYRDGLENASQTKQLAKSGNKELARENQLRNPWVNFYYYDSKATNAGRDLGIDLGLWGQQSLSKLAQQDPAERAASIAGKAKDLMGQYADLPQAFIAAKIDPIIAGVTQDLKEKAVVESYAQKVLTDNNTVGEKFYGALKSASKMHVGSLGAEEGIELSTSLIQAGYEDARNYYVNQRGYTEKEFHAVLGKELGRLFIDNDGDTYNDIGDAFGAQNIIGALSDIRTSDGQKLLSLKDDKGNTFQQLIQDAGAKAVKQNETFYNAQERILQRAKREVERKLNNAVTDFYAANPNPTEDQITAQRNQQKALIDELAFRGELPDGVSSVELKKDVDKAYSYVTRDLSPSQKQLYEAQIDSLVNQGLPMPEELADELRGTELYATAVGKFADAAVKEADPKFNENRTNIVKDLTSLLPGFFESDTDYQTIIKTAKGENVTQAKKALKNAVAAAKPRFEAEAEVVVTGLMNQALSDGQNVNDPTVRAGILEQAKSRLSSLPQYSDVDNYFNVTGAAGIGRPAPSKIPVLATTSGNGKTEEWDITIEDSDQRATWAAISAPYFKNDVQASREYLKNNFVFNNNEFKQLNRYINSNGDSSQITPQLRSTLGNLKKAFGNELPLSEIVGSQIRRFYGQQYLAPTLKKALNQLDARSAEGGGGTSPVSASIIVTNWHHGHSGNNAVDFMIQRPSGQYQNPIPAPFSGTVISANDESGFGRTVVIEASQSGRGYKRGDLVRLAHLANFSVIPGQKIVRGAQVGMSGDGYSAPGEGGGTGAGTNGHVHIQLYKPGGVTRAFQYPQVIQNQFVRNNYANLFNEQDLP
jgi:murein DD-endopeptidase MepM/ murein hydrolase activator NlpD